MLDKQRELKKVLLRIGGALLMFLALYNFLLVPASQLEVELTTRFSGSTTVYILTSLLSSLAYSASFMLPVLFFYMISRKSGAEPMWLSLSFSPKRPVFSTLAVVFLGTSVCIACSYVNSILIPVPDRAYEVLLTSDFDAGYKLILQFISTAIVPAFVEEFLFRGMILSNIHPYSERSAIFISAILFGLMHQTPFQFLYATAIGVVLGVVYVKTKTIWCGVLLHFFNNFFSVLQSYFLEVLDTHTGNLVYSIMMCTVAMLGILLGGIFYVVSHTKAKEAEMKDLGVYGKEASDLAFGEKVSGGAIIKALCNPTMLIFVIFCLVSIVSTTVLMYMI